MPRGQVNKRFLAYSHPSALVFRALAMKKLIFLRTSFLFSRQKFDSLDFYCQLSEGKNGRRFPRCTTAMCVFLSLRWMYVASAFVRSSGSRLSGIFKFFSFGQQMRSIALLPGDLFTNSRLCEICSTAASRSDASAVHETTSGAIPPRNSLIHFRFFFRVLCAG